MWFRGNVSTLDGTADTTGRTDLGPARAIYGTLLASGLVAALDTTHSTPRPYYDLAWLVITLATAAVAHGYSMLLTEHPAPGERLVAARRAVLGEWPLVAAGAPTVIVLLVTALVGGSAGDGPIYLALAINVCALFGWGLAGARSAGYGLFAALGVATIDAVFGLAIIGLNILVK